MTLLGLKPYPHSHYFCTQALLLFATILHTHNVCPQCFWMFQLFQAFQVFQVFRVFHANEKNLTKCAAWLTFNLLFYVVQE